MHRSLSRNLGVILQITSFILLNNLIIQYNDEKIQKFHVPQGKFKSVFLKFDLI